MQRFKSAYEISHTLRRRYPAANPAPPEIINAAKLADLIRIANQQDLLLCDWPRWKDFRDMRARTGHSDTEAIALDVVAWIPGFLDEARFLRDRLRQRWAE